MDMTRKKSVETGPEAQPGKWVTVVLQHFAAKEDGSRFITFKTETGKKDESASSETDSASAATDSMSAPSATESASSTTRSGKWQTGGRLRSRIRITSEVTQKDTTIFFVTESSSKPTSSASAPSSASQTPSQTSSRPTPTQTAPGDPQITISTTNLVAIVGGIIGGIVVLLVVIGIIRGFMRRKRAERENNLRMSERTKRAARGERFGNGDFGNNDYGHDDPNGGPDNYPEAYLFRSPRGNTARSYHGHGGGGHAGYYGNMNMQNSFEMQNMAAELPAEHYAELPCPSTVGRGVASGGHGQTRGRNGVSS